LADRPSRATTTSAAAAAAAATGIAARSQRLNPLASEDECDYFSYRRIKCYFERGPPDFFAP
jgi:hypothetical protein